MNFDYKNIIVVTLIIVGAIIVTKVARKLITKSFEAASDKLKVDATRYKFFKNAVSLVIWIIAFAAVTSLIPSLKSLALTLFAGAGIMVAVIGFAAQAAFSNIISGVFIVLFKPFSVGDIIRVGTDYYGEVEDITLRHTVILSFENKRIVIPNSNIDSDTIVNENLDDERICRWIEFGISYDSDVDLATKIIQEEALKHPHSIDGRTKEEIAEGIPVVEVRLISFGDSSVNLRAYVWTDKPRKAFRLHSDLNKAVKERFDAEGVEIPFPYRTVVYKNDLPPNKKLDGKES